MKYHVNWKPLAEDNLALIWIMASDRNAVNQAAIEIDRLLENDPNTVGESRSGNSRVAFVGPLTVYFEVHEPDRLVHVLTLRYHGPTTGKP